MPTAAVNALRSSYRRLHAAVNSANAAGDTDAADSDDDDDDDDARCRADITRDSLTGVIKTKVTTCYRLIAQWFRVSQNIRSVVHVRV